MKFILFCVTLDLSDTLTEMRIAKNSNVIGAEHMLSQANFTPVRETLHDEKGTY